jgi:stearoyl-CoA desaturase (delta-9 desaturase)
VVLPLAARRLLTVRAARRAVTHRHRAARPQEYAMAWLGCMAVQGDPIEWVGNHRVHHMHTDTPLDPHSPYEGFWWSHMGWLLAKPWVRGEARASAAASDHPACPVRAHMQAASCAR